MELQDLIANTPPREVAGARTSRQYDYQKDISLFLLINYHDKKEDYVFLFDYHDDLVMIDSEEKPNKMDFFQVKTKESGTWNTAGLLRRTDSDKFSILGKLYANRVNFGKHVKGLILVSNAGFRIKTSKNESLELQEEITLGSINDKDVDKIIIALKSEHQLKDISDLEDLLVLNKTKLSYDDASTHCKGAFHDLFTRLNPEYSGNVTLAYNKVFNEIRILTRAIIADPNERNWSNIIAKKGLTKKQFSEILKISGAYKSLEKSWEDIEPLLASSGLGYLELTKLKGAWRTVQAQLLSSPTNIPLSDTVKYIQRIIEEVKQDPAVQQIKLYPLINGIGERCTALPTQLFDETFIRALILKQLVDE